MNTKVDSLQSRVKELERTTAGQRAIAANLHDEYLRGLSNGLIMALSIISGSEADYLDHPNDLKNEAEIAKQHAHSILHDLKTGEPDTAPKDDPELLDFVHVVSSSFQKSLLLGEAPSLNLVKVLLHRARLISESRKSMYIPYSEMVEKLFKNMDTPAASLMHAAIGIAGEGGEILDATKKHWVYEKPLDVPNMLEEMGDIYFYMQKIMNMFGWTLLDIQMANRAKLGKRYPDGVYSNKDAQARADKVIVKG